MRHHDLARVVARFALPTACAALVAGCATPVPPLQKYAAPTSGPTAKIVMRGTLAGSDFYGVYVFDQAESCQGSRLIGAGRTGRDAPASTVVANRLTTLDFMMFSGDNSSCRVRWSFTPTAGRTYVVSGGVVTGIPGASCAARIHDATDPDAIRPVADALRRNQGGAMCMPTAQALARRAATPAAAQATGDSAVLTSSAGDAELQGLIKP